MEGSLAVGRRREVLALAAGWVVTRGAGSAWATTGVGQVLSSTGLADVVRGNAVIALAAGDAVYAEDIVRTGPDSRLQIVCNDGLQIVVGAGTELAVRSYLTSTSDGRLEILLGLLRGIARLIGGASPTPRTVEIDTRTAVASVRSTEWLIESTDKGTAVLAIQGEVTVLGLAGGRVVLEPGQGTDVAPGAAPRTPATWGQARRLDAIARTTI